MAEENNKGNFDRKVIPYNRTFGSGNTDQPTVDSTNHKDMVQSDTGDRDTLLNNSYPLGFRDLNPEDTGQPTDDLPQNVVEPIGQKEDVEKDDTEFAQEAAHWGPRIDGENRSQGESRQDEGRQARGEGFGWGIVGLILSFIGIFIWPIVFATAGIITGYIAFRNGARAMGTWSMVIGAFALLMALFLLPAYFR